MKGFYWGHDGINCGRMVCICLVVLFYDIVSVSDSLDPDEMSCYAEQTVYTVQLAAAAPPIHTSTCAGSNFKTVLENITVGTTLFEVNVTDSDTNDDISISMNPLTAQYVNVTKLSGTRPWRFIVKLRRQLDRETDPYPIALQFTATDKSGNTDPIKCDIYETDVNDNKPMFLNLPYTWEIRERPSNYSRFTSIKATDQDIASFGAVSYSITPTTQSDQRKHAYSNTFSIDTNSGIVSVKGNLDYEQNNYYQFKVTAKDGGGLTSTTDLIIRVLDVQDTPPFFTRSSYRTEIQEEMAKGSSVLKLNAEDGDRGIPNKVGYAITGGTCASLFSIFDNGTIITEDRIDRDNNIVLQDSGICNLTVKAKEINTTNHKQYGNTTATTHVIIDVTDINDNGPVFNSSQVNATVSENTPANVPIQLKQNLGVSDKDQGPNAIILLSVHWPDDTNCTDFAVQPPRVSGSASIVITVQNPALLDYEHLKNLTFKVKATDQNKGTFTDTVTVTLSITDINDNNPVFENTNTSFHLNENSANGTTIDTITASDKDTTSQGRLTYHLSGGDGRFVVNQTTGLITTSCSECKKTFDREKYSDFTLSYTVKDEGERPATISLTVKLDDVNDNIPIFYRKQFESFISEYDNDTTHPIVTLDATDKDATNKSNVVHYSLLHNATDLANNFSCNNLTGEIFLTSALDYELLESSHGIVNLTAVVRDDGTPSLYSTASVIVRVQDENDNSPIFTQDMYQANVSEDATSNTTTRTNVINITAIDIDGTRRNSEFHYYIVGGSLDKFAMNSTTGEVYVQVNSKLDRETIPLYNITMNAIDQGSPAHTTTATLSVTLTDVNDEPPKFKPQHYNASVKEGNAMGVINTKATDPDILNQLQYSIVKTEAVNEKGNSVNPSLIQDYFEINESNGTVFATNKTDREKAKHITLSIQVKDTKAKLNTPQTATAEVEITLLDVNDNPPAFDKPSYTISVIENAPMNDMLLQVHATDKDENRTITYTLVDTEWKNQTFHLEPSTGKLLKVGKLDRETKEHGLLVITATDNGVPTRSASVNVSVNVLDFNDNPPVFRTPNKTVHVLHVLENQTNGSQILCMNATDEDKGPNSNVTYAISSGDRGNISVNSITGCLSVVNTLDRETVPVYNLILKALDNPKDLSTQKSSTATLQIIIDDVNDNSPRFTKQLFSAKFPENENNGTAVLTVTAIDDDEGANSKITYYVNGSNLFRIDSNSGVISIDAQLKDKVDNYSLVVTASDHGQQPLSSNVTVKLEVTDVNLWSPVITNIPDKNKIDIFECVPDGTIFHTFSYTDNDHGLNSEAFFNMTALDTPSAHTLTVLANGSLATTRELDASNITNYKIQVHATDRGTPPLKSKEITINIKVLDVNDHLPTFPDKPIYTAILENHTDINVVNVSATDVDKNSVPCYSILEGPWKDYFNISEHGGQIYNVQDFDYENTTQISFVVHVEDCSVKIDTKNMCPNTTKFPDRNANQTITLKINDIDDNPPIFQRNVISTGMRRTTPDDTTLQLHLRNSTYITDKDSPRNGYLSWRFENGGEIIPSENLKGKVNTTSGKKACGNATKAHYIFCIDGNGTITNNKFFNEDLFGYFNVPVRVSDKAGSDKAIIKVYLIGDSQILFMVVQDDKEKVSLYKDNILGGYSSVTGHTFVYDWIEDHKEGDRVVTTKSDLYFHVVDKDGENVLSAKDAVRLVDSNAEKLTLVQRNYHVQQIMSSKKNAVSENDSSLKFYILVAIVVVLSLTLVAVIYAGLTTKSKYKQKLKAATIKSVDTATEMVDGKFSVPGSNQYSKQSNPLLNADTEKTEAKYDAMSLSSDNSIDINEVDDPQKHETVYDTMEEREVTLDMYTEDTYTRRPEEDPLDAALRMHEQLKARRDSQELADDSDHSDDVQGMQFSNVAYDDMESTEI